MTRVAPLRVPTAPTIHIVALLATCLILPSGPLGAQSLRGSPTSLDRQNAAADKNDFTFLRSGSQVRSFVEMGYLVRVSPSDDLALKGVSYPYARKEVAMFLDRLSGEYRASCGEPLVVTSLTRPMNDQPANASERSVHPTGMAADLHLPSSPACRHWLEHVLIDLEKARVLEATREHYPAHYHVAVFPREYATYVATLNTRQTEQQEERVALERLSYKVRPGDSLWTIARRHGTTVDALREINELESSRIFAGQVLEVPTAR
jgi:LysM domain/Family of unknown function (DUF5715)